MTSGDFVTSVERCSSLMNHWCIHDRVVGRHSCDRASEPVDCLPLLFRPVRRLSRASFHPSSIPSYIILVGSYGDKTLELHGFRIVGMSFIAVLISGFSWFSFAWGWSNNRNLIFSSYTWLLFHFIKFNEFIITIVTVYGLCKREGFVIQTKIE